MPRSRWIGVLGLCFLLLAFVIVFQPLFRCVVQGTTIDTPFGARAIEDLKVGDIVWSRDLRGELSTSTVLAVKRSFTLRYLCFALADGRRLEVTASHPLATKAGWTEAGRISSGETVEARFGPVVATRVESAISWKAVYDLSVEPHANFFANGVLVHNKSVTSWESQAIGDSRYIVSAMQTYASANCGFYPRDLTDATRHDGTPIAIPNFLDEAPTLCR